MAPFLGKTPCSPHLLGRLIQLSQTVKLPGGEWGRGGEGALGKMPTQPLLLPPLRSLPSQRLRPESLCQRLDPLCHTAGGLTHSHAEL